MRKPLEGIKVIECTQVMAGPLVGMFLADYGADVIKVEPPEGEWGRHQAPPGSKLEAARMGPNFPFYHRNKRDIVLNLSLDKGREIFHKLVEVADVLVENIRPGAMEKLGLGYEPLSRINPRLIYASISALGHRGPEAHSRGLDYLAQARAGIVTVRRYHDGTPVVPSVFAADQVCALMVCYGIALCLMEREKSGLGQKIEASLLGAATYMNASRLVQTEDGAASGPRLDALNMPYKCQDGRFIFISSYSNHHAQALCKATGLPHLAEDEAFQTQASRQNNVEIIHSILENAFSLRPAREWVPILQGFGVPAALVQEPEEVFLDPQVQANRFMIEQVHPVLGPVRMVGMPFRLCRTEGGIRFGAPSLGEHTSSVLTELGYNEPEILQLEEEGVTRPGP